MFGEFKKGADAEHEEYNRTYKRNIVSNSEKGIQSARIMTEMAGTVKGWQANLSATKEVSVDGEKRKSRTSTDHVEDVRLCAAQLIQRGVFQKAASTTPSTVPSRFDGGALKTGMSPLELEKYGINLMKTWAEEYRTRPKVDELPKMKRGKSYIPKKVGNIVIEAGDEGTDGTEFVQPGETVSEVTEGQDEGIEGEGM